MTIFKLKVMSLDNDLTQIKFKFFKIKDGSLMVIREHLCLDRKVKFTIKSGLCSIPSNCRFYQSSRQVT